MSVKINHQSMSNWLVSGAVLLALLVIGRDFFVPLVFAVLIWAVINAIVGVLERRKIPPFMAWSAAFGLIIIALWFTTLVLVNETSDVIGQAPQLAQKVQTLVRDKMGLGNFVPALDVTSLSHNDSVRSYVGVLAASAGGTLADLVLVLIYVGFLLAEQGHIPEKIARLQKNNSEREGEEVVRAIGHQVQTYLGVCTLASAVMAACTYALLTVMGVDFAAFWALAMFMLTYIPTVGAIGVVLPAFMALAQFGTVGPGLVIAVILFAVHFLLTSVIETVLLGRTLDLSPFAIIVSLTFWGLVWGVAGLFLAVPLTGAIAIVCRHIVGLEWISEVLSGSHVVRSRRRLRFGPG
jgi:predicted PurR-regulated permease PerM